jgi:heme exporter protein CcmD
MCPHRPSRRAWRIASPARNADVSIPGDHALMSDFLFQGGYAFYVWSAYAVSVFGVGTLIASTLAAWRKAKRALAVLQDSETNL